MFFTYLGRELRRRVRQASLIAIGLALGIGLVITVTALSAGVKNAQGEVLHSLYGVGTDITVTKTPTAQSSRPDVVRLPRRVREPRPRQGRHQDRRRQPGQPGRSAQISTTAVTTISQLHNVAAVAGGLTLTDTKISGKIPVIQLPAAAAAGSRRRRWRGRGRHLPRDPQRRARISVSGVDLCRGRARPAQLGQAHRRPDLHLRPTPAPTTPS